ETNGGTANLGHLFENYPGFESIAGAELMEKFVAHARKFGTEIKNEKVLKLVKIENGFAVQTEKEKYECESLLIALGTQHRKLNVPGEDRLTGRGVSYCFTCDGYF
ncbi:thioredoxin-disulfide reductase, partial [Candidatus Peregrinibacteria bacterium CG08_land_8_20_14_0_20_41_10]